MPAEGLIAPEILNDAFFRTIERLASDPEVRTMLEIGSSSGEGSTRAFVQGMSANPCRPRLFCLETAKDRFAALRRRYAHLSEVFCYNASSVSRGDVLSEEQLRHDYLANRDRFPLETILQWRREGLEYEAREAIPENGIRTIKREHGIETFDLVLIDGGEFTGEAELREVYGARYLLLDDIATTKCRRAYEALARDPLYELIGRDATLRNGFAVFRRARTDLPIHFFTLVLNGHPFIEQHIERFQQLTVPWTWHIVEGAAALKHDTAWSVRTGGSLDDSFHREGLSVDGTTHYLNALQAAFPEQVKVHRKTGGGLFDGKVEMIRGLTATLSEECLLWEIDVDEFWTPEQIHEAHRMFMADGSRTAAYYLCDFHVGPELVTTTVQTYANHLGAEWLRTWRFRPGQQWLTHEPPRLVSFEHGPQAVDIAHLRPFTQHDTAARGLVFQHLAYVREEQLAFKEKYYGYKDALAGWRRLQDETRFPAELKHYFSWVTDDTRVEPAGERSLSAQFAALKERLDRQAPARGRIVIDGVFFQGFRRSGIAQVWISLLQEWAGTDFGARLVVVDRDRTAPRIDGLLYADLPGHRYEALELDQSRLESLCLFYGASLFISTYNTRPLTTPSLYVAYDLIPESDWFDLKQPMWREKSQAIAAAGAYLSISESTRRDLERFYPWVSKRPSRVVLLASRFQRKTDAEQAEFRLRYNLHRPFYFLVGASTYYKNSQYFFEAFAQLRTRAGFEVVCTNSHGLEKYRADGTLLRELDLSDHDMACAYSAAEALIYPSLIEGFGMPILEAMSCGCPVLTFRHSSLPEVAGEAAVYCDPKSPEDLARQLCRLQHAPDRERQVLLGYKRARQFSWEKAAGEFRQFVDSLALAAPVRPTSVSNLPLLPALVES